MRGGPRPLGHAGAASIWRPAGHEHPQRLEARTGAAGLARSSLHRPGDVVLRICRYQTTQDADLVRVDDDRPLGLRGPVDPWRGLRGPKSNPVVGQRELFGFLTTEANAIVAPIHPKAMPVILTSAGGGRPVARGRDDRGAEVAAAVAGRHAQDRGEEGERGRRLRPLSSFPAPIWFVAAFIPMVASQVLRLHQHDPGGWLFWDYAGRLGGLAVLAAHGLACRIPP